MIRQVPSGDHCKYLLTDEQIYEGIYEAASTIELCAGHQRRIMTDALTFAQLGSQPLGLHLNEAKPADLLATILKMFKAEAEIAGVKLCMRLDREPGDPDVAHRAVLLDAGRVLQILINMTANAIKFTRDCAERCVTVSLAISGARPVTTPQLVEYLPRGTEDAHLSTAVMKGKPVYLQFSVEDTGPGLSSNEVGKLFNRFTQTSPRVYSQHGGYGLGLYISRHLAELQSGRVCVSSKSGIGSTFSFYIEAYLGISEPVADKRPVAATIEAVDRSIHCLIVEDNQIIRQVLSKQLEKLGIQVSVANHGLKALSLIEGANNQHKTAPISVVLMDLHMPVMDGIACVQKIRSMEHCGKLSGHLPVVGISGSDRQDLNARAIKQGMVQTPPPKRQITLTANTYGRRIRLFKNLFISLKFWVIVTARPA